MNVTNEPCPVSMFTEMLGGKWKLIIINIIRKRGVIRFGQLAASIPNISRKVLTDQLKSLESYEPLTDITSARFEKIKLKS